MIDVKQVRARIHQYLESVGWVPRDADGSDYSFMGEPSGYRFKVGTKLGEVTITSWYGSKPTGLVRINTDQQIPQAESWILSRARATEPVVE